MKKIILVLIIIVSLNSKAQPTITWQKCLGGTSSDYGTIQQTIEGGFILTGTTSSNNGDVSGNHGSQDIWVAKLSSIGEIQWQKCLGGTLSDDGVNIQQTTDGGYILSSTTNSNNGDVSGNHGSQDIWIVKLSSTGAIQWQKCLGGTSDESGGSILQTTDGGYILSGSTNSNNGDVSGNHTNSIFYDNWVVKLSSTGSIQWQKCLGGTSNDLAGFVTQTTDGGYILSCTTSSNNGDVSVNHGSQDIWIVKLSSTGSIQWQKCLGGTSDESGGSILQTTDGGYILSGSTNSNNGDVSGNHGSSYDAWIIKLSNLGAIEWQRCMGSFGDDGGSIKQITSDGGFIFGGNSSNSNNGDVSGHHGGPTDIWIVKLSSTGSIQWQKCLGGSNSESGSSIFQTPDGGYILSGYTSSNDADVSGNHGSFDVWIVKLSSYLELIDSSNSNIFIIYPNPVFSVLNVKSNFNFMNLPYSIFDGLGRVVMNGKLNEVNTLINVEQLSKGIYYLKVLGNSASKFIKE